MKKAMFLAGGLLVATIGLAAMAEFPVSIPVAIPNDQGSELTVVVDLKNSPGKITHGSYGDVASSLTEMARASDLVVIATVEGQRQFSNFTVSSTLRVSRVIKGALPSAPVTVYQFGSLAERNGELLMAGTKYFLFLGKQTDSAANTFHIKGGQQGLFVTGINGLVGDKLMLQSIDLDQGVEPFLLLERAVLKAIR